MSSYEPQPFEVFLNSNELQFSSAHFIARANHRERLHGHNYQLTVRLIGQVDVNDGHLISSKIIKKAARDLCLHLNEKFLCPQLSKNLKIHVNDKTKEVTIACPDQSRFSFPKDDCVMLPIHHTTGEELSQYCFALLLRLLTFTYLKTRRVIEMEVGVMECAGQQACFRLPIPDNEEELKAFLPQALRNLPPISQPSARRSITSTTNPSRPPATPPSPRPPVGPPSTKSVTPVVPCPPVGPPATKSADLPTAPTPRPPSGPPTTMTSPPRPPVGPPMAKSSLAVGSPMIKCNVPRPPPGPPTTKSSSLSTQKSDIVGSATIPPLKENTTGSSLSSLFSSVSFSSPKTQPRAPPGPPPRKIQNHQNSTSITDESSTQCDNSHEMYIEQLEQSIVQHILDSMTQQIEVENQQLQMNEYVRQATDKWAEADRIRTVCQNQSREMQTKEEELVKKIADLRDNEKSVEVERKSLEEDRRILSNDMVELQSLRESLQISRLELQEERDEFEGSKEEYMDECHILLNKQLASERIGLEDEYNSAFVKLEDDHSHLRERIVVVNEQREILTKIISDYQENTKYVVELCRILKGYHDSVSSQRTLINQERLKLDFALRDLNRIKFESASESKLKAQKKSGPSLSGLLTSVHSLSSVASLSRKGTNTEISIHADNTIDDDEDGCPYIDIRIDNDGLEDCALPEKGVPSPYVKGLEKQADIPVIKINMSKVSDRSAQLPFSPKKSKQVSDRSAQLPSSPKKSKQAPTNVHVGKTKGNSKMSIGQKKGDIFASISSPRTTSN